MSLDKTVENVNLMLTNVNSNLNELLTVFRWGILLIVMTFCFMIVALTVLCCYVKCCEIRNVGEMRKADETNSSSEKIYLPV